MSRAKIGGVVALVVAALTATAYILTTSSLEAKIHEDVNRQVARSRDLLEKNASFDSLDLIKRAELFARDARLVAALAPPAADADPKLVEANAHQTLQVIQGEAEARAKDKEKSNNEKAPDWIALVNLSGKLVSIDSGAVPTDWGTRYPAVAKALDPKELRTYKDIWDWDNDLMEIAASPVIDPSTGELRGVVVVGFSLRSPDEKAKLLGTQVAYFDKEKVRGTSFGKAGTSEESAIPAPVYQKALAKDVLEGDRDAAAKVRTVKLGSSTWVASAVPLPMNFSGRPAGAMVLMNVSDMMAPVSSVKLTILLLGLGALAIAVLAMLFTARVILAPAEEIELGVTEIINGNIDYTFKPVGADLDGLANALNVMLARLLGRPEPGEEEYDEDGNVAGGSSKVLLDEEAPSVAALGGATAPDAETLALAKEPESDYYHRIYNEYIAARKAAGENVDGVTYEGFTAKLRLNEGTLKKKYNCKAVRFRVQTKDGQVTLKPVPIL